MTPRPIDTAPKDRRIQLFVPGEGAWAAAWWYGSYNWIEHSWALHVYATAGDKQVHMSQLPHQPTHWLPSPEDP